MKAGPDVPVAIVNIVLASIPVTLLHELGHAIVARRRLGTEVQVSVGSAAKVAEIKLGEIIASVYAFDRPDRLGGIATFDASRATASDIAGIAIAGPLTSLAGLLLAIALYNTVSQAGFIRGIAWAMVLASVFAVVVNLIPFEVQERRGQAPKRTDGKLFLHAFVARRFR